jgi:hypothetical protein
MLPDVVQQRVSGLVAAQCTADHLPFARSAFADLSSHTVDRRRAEPMGTDCSETKRYTAGGRGL